MNPTQRATTPPLTRTIARGLAVALAIGVVAWLAWRAQREADARIGGPPADGAASEGDAANLVTLPAQLNSSKSLVIEDVTDPTSIPSSKSAVLPTVEAPAEVPPHPIRHTLYSSKSGAPIAPPTGGGGRR